jgi:hypothetical protein
VKDASDPDLLHSKAEGLTKRKDEKFRDETKGRKVINILISRINNLSLVGIKGETYFKSWTMTRKEKLRYYKLSRKAH